MNDPQPNSNGNTSSCKLNLAYVDIDRPEDLRVAEAVFKAGQQQKPVEGKEGE